jgi:hypothetical protein
VLIKPPVPVEQVSSPDDRFRCKPYGAVLTARACLSRQDLAALPGDQRKEDYVFCQGCTLGETVRAKFTVPVEDLLKKKPPKRRPSRKPKHRPDDTIAPSKATREAVAAQPAALPMKPPQRRAPRALVLTSPPSKRSAPPPSTPPSAPTSPKLDVLRAGLRQIEAGVSTLAARTSSLLSAVRSARARLAAR